MESLRRARNLPARGSETVCMGRIRDYLMWRFVNRNPRFRRLLLKLTVPNRDVDVVLFGSRLRVNQRQEIGYVNAAKLAQRSVVWKDESSVLATLALLLEPGDTFIDVGANVGLYSAVIGRAARVFGQMRVYAFEPNPDTVRRLRETLRGENVKIFDCALSNRDGELEFCEAAGSWAFGVKSDANIFQISGRTQRIAARRLDGMAISGDSIVLKIDAETHEREVVEGAEGLIRSGRVKAIYLDGYEDRSLPDYFRSMGFDLFDGREMRACEPPHSLLALNRQHLERWNRKLEYRIASAS